MSNNGDLGAGIVRRKALDPNLHGPPPKTLWERALEAAGHALYALGAACERGGEAMVARAVRRVNKAQQARYMSEPAQPGLSGELSIHLVRRETRD